MVDQEQARKILQERLADNLVIVTEFENPKEWCFDLGLITESGTIMPLMGDTTIRISKETGEVE
ncbi:hypothetical protein bpr_IV064 (plasmid) [Butyrivibrio proteoclasticus B316]|uniref:Uncharacterized protein n=1 Tax=Butyrivibrio proteoclasticus (strain ATCC 51982 / DSM 14932 / B316) TaxID=515622 RepID=E0S4U7_BUTPB|nr:hypothetical protein [Butyrivibrio proteoclasticus]ADL36429.1 hypothetical protein bpr_IV064 [Butyrivibrio proteoclasticus B316]